MNEIILHIGPHKTGSTYIQKALHENHELILKQGFFYPDNLIGPQWGHHRLVEAIKFRNKNDINSFRKSLSRKNIISSENFEDLNIEDIKFFCEMFSSYEITLIFFKRDFKGALYSSWQESIKHGNTNNFKEYGFDALLRPYSSTVLRSIKIIENWQSILKPRKTVILPYDQIKTENKDILIELTNTLKIDTKGFKGLGSKINHSMSYLDVEILRVFNSIFKIKGYKVNHNVRDLYLSKISKDERTATLRKIVKENTQEISMEPSWTLNFLNNSFNRKHNINSYKNVVQNTEHYISSIELPLSDTFMNTALELFKDYKDNL